MNKSSTLQEKIIKGSVIVLIFSLLGSVCAYLIRILFSRTLSIENYGLFYAVFGLIGMITTYSDLGFGYSVVYFLPKHFKKKNYFKAWNVYIYGQFISLLMSLAASTILVAFAPFLARNFLKVEGSEVLIYIFCFYLVIFSILNGLIQIFCSIQKEKYYSLITLFRWLFSFIIAFSFFAFGFSNIVYFALALVLGHLLTAVIFLYLLFSKYSFLTRNKIVWNKNIFKLMFSFALPALLETLIYSLSGSTETFFLTLMRGVREVGIYNIIYPLASIPIILLNPINGILLPLVSRLMEGEKEKMEKLLKTILEIVPFIGLYFALFLILFPSSIVGLIFGERWIGLVETPLRILSLGAIVIPLFGVLGAITLGTGKVKEKLKVVAITQIISMIVNIFLIWNFGILGAVVTTGLTSLVLSILFIRILKTDLIVIVPIKFYLKLLMFSLILGTIVQYLAINLQNWVQFISIGVIYTTVYAGLGFWLKLYDKKLLFMFLPKKLN